MLIISSATFPKASSGKPSYSDYASKLSVFREEDIARLGDEFQDAYKKTSREEFESQYFL